jgi:signal transduction histidine kinase
VTALLDRVLKYVADHWTGQPVQVERRYASNLPPVPLDETLLEQALLNLVQNAYEAMEERGGTLRVEARLAPEGVRPGVELRLSDTGPGIPDALREEIFNPFVTTKKTGVGLGLSIVSKIIDGHHGSIRVENGPLGGACFTLFFPVEEIGEPDSMAEITAG